MKTVFSYIQSTAILLLSVFVVSCSAPDPKAELEQLKKQRSELDTKIADLEASIAKTDTTQTAQKATEVAVSPVQTRIFKTYIEVQARVDADQNVFLSSGIPGTVTKINVKVGDKVTQGQVLAETDSRMIQQQISDLQTNYELVKQVYEKQEELWKQKIGTEIQYLQAKSNKESLEKKMATLEEQLRMSKIISPINGTVDGVNIKIGQTVAPGMNAITVVNFSNLKVKAEVAESYSSRIKTGDEVLIYFPDNNDSIVSKINYASRTIDLLNRTFDIEALLNTSDELHPNMVAKMKINDYQSAKPCIVLPVKFIQKSSTGNYVLVAENGKVVKKVITIGREYSGLAEVTGGLNEGEQLIVKGYDLVIDGDAITVQK
ncbi:MAG: efflux RND transporter periplasmic adaptor subunit [Bacteroidia bacterium]|jgi:RND family efflux transporter MFP subunit|nr:efflux RND transporter periplasmic adaptor subunit [Bacteroidia bacterium]